MSSNSPDASTHADECDLSIVMPCLNEADTLAQCISDALTGIETAGVTGEVIVADNGSTDGSQGIAIEGGARLVHVEERGYGQALMGGIEAARGKYVIMGDADSSYDFLETPRFVEKLKEGYELVQGCRLKRGGGKIDAGAMPFLHRYFGNPLFSFMVRLMFKAPIHDVYCGLRGFTGDLYDRLKQRCTGMEFATEMIIKSTLFGARIAEVPITLRPDGRQTHGPHLRTFRDGWRTLRFFMLYSPRWLYRMPGVILMLLGLAGYLLAIPGIKIGAATLDVHTLLVSSLFILIGYQGVLFSFLAQIFAVGDHLAPETPGHARLLTVATLERGILASVLVFLAGVAIVGAVSYGWYRDGFGVLDYSRTMRWLIPGVTLCALGVQNLMGSFFASILGMRRK